MTVTIKKTGRTAREITLTTSASPEAVFDYLADFERHPEWCPELVKMERLTDPPAGVGTRYRTTEAMKEGSRMTDETSCEIVALERPRRIEWTARTAAERGPMAMRSRWEFVIEPDGNGSRVTQRYSFAPPNIWAGVMLRVFSFVADTFLGGMGASPKNVRRHAERLSETLDGKATAAEGEVASPASPETSTG